MTAHAPTTVSSAPIHVAGVYLGEIVQLGNGQFEARLSNDTSLGRFDSRNHAVLVLLASNRIGEG